MTKRVNGWMIGAVVAVAALMVMGLWHHVSRRHALSDSHGSEISAKPLAPQVSVVAVTSAPARAGHALRPFDRRNSSQAVATVVGDGGVVGYKERCDALGRLDQTPDRPSLDALYGWLASPEDPGGLAAGELNSLKNEVADRLLQVDPLPTDFADRLIVMYEDETLDPVWRDYCVQFLGSVYGRLADPQAQGRVALTLWRAVDDHAEATAGTALIALHRNVGMKGIGQEALGRKAIDVCRSDMCIAARATALQVAASVAAPEALGVARSIAPSGPVPLRMAALAALGRLGDATDRPLLQQCSTATDPRLRTAARAALACFERSRQ